MKILSPLKILALHRLIFSSLRVIVRCLSSFQISFDLRINRAFLRIIGNDVVRIAFDDYSKVISSSKIMIKCEVILVSFRVVFIHNFIGKLHLQYIEYSVQSNKTVK